MDNHVHVSGLNAVITVLYIIAIMGTINLVAKKYPDSKLSASWRYVWSQK